MNVYEALATSPLNMAWHEKSGLMKLAGDLCMRTNLEHPDGWQPLYASDEVEQWKHRAKKAEAQLYEACRQLAGEYVLGEPLTERKNGKRYIAIHKETGEIRQGQFIWNGPIRCKTHTYYADPRPWPQKPEVKEEPKLVEWVGHNRYQLTAEGAARLEKLLRESEGE